MTARRSAVVTGAGRGIGAAVARRLAREEMGLLLVDSCGEEPLLGYPLSSRDELEQTARACRQAGSPSALTAVVDVRQRGALETAVRDGAGELGGLDAAVAAAGVIAGGPPAWETAEDAWQLMIDVNLTGAFHLFAAAVPLLLERPQPRNGRLVAVSSAGGAVGLPKLSGYVAAKHGVVGLIRSVAAELGGTGVTANVVLPGTTRTAMAEASAAVYGLADVSELAVHHVNGRLLEPEEVAEAVFFLVSPASSGMTGSVVAVDGGMTAR